MAEWDRACPTGCQRLFFGGFSPGALIRRVVVRQYGRLLYWCGRSLRGLLRLCFGRVGAIIGSKLFRVVQRLSRRLCAARTGSISKTYAVGYRLNEVGLPNIEKPSNGDRIDRRGRRMPRSKNFRRLPFGYVKGYAPISPDRNDLETLEGGFYKRVAGVTRFQSQPLDLVRLSVFSGTLAKSLFDPVLVGTSDSYIQHLSFPESKKFLYREALRENGYVCPDARIRSKVSGFPKLEAYDEWKYPRWILARNHHFRVFIGPFIRAMERVVYQLRVFIKHTPVAERPARIAELDRHVSWFKYQTDWSSMEKHFDPPRMRALEFPLYEHLLQLYPEAVSVLKQTLTGTNRISTRGGFRARVRGKRCSGELNTSLGNGWANYVVFAYIVHMKGGEFEGFVEGDDGIFASSVRVTTEDYANLGFDVKVVEHTTVTTASFCGIVSATDGTLLKEPRRFLSKFGWTGSDIHSNEDHCARLLRAKALSAVYEAPQCPILSVLAREALRRTAGEEPLFVEDGYHDTARVPRDEKQLAPFAPSDEARELFFQLYKVSPANQIFVENQILLGNVDVIAEYLPPSDVSYDYFVSYIEEG